MSRPKGAPKAAGLLRALTAALADDPAPQAAESFARQAVPDVAPGELPELTPEAVADTLADFWRFGAQRRTRRPLLRVAAVDAPPWTQGEEVALERLEIVQDDAPFLVDSVMGEIAEQGLSVRAMVHPIVELRRDSQGHRVAGAPNRRESMILAVLDALGPDREAALAAGVKATLDDVHAAVADFPAMLQLLSQTLAELRQRPGKATPEEFAFLEWLEAQQFVFLGARVYEFPRLPNGDYAPEEPLYQAKDGLGVLRDPNLTVLRRASEPAILMGAGLERMLAQSAVTVAKANAKSRVHRRGYMDYVGVKRYDAAGRPCGEVRFVGLFTAEAYDEPVTAVPLVREKVARVLKAAHAIPGGHNEKRLRNILENHPRDELFQMTADELLAQAMGILHIYDRPRVALFERRDPFDRFASVLLFLPRDQYDSELERRAGQILANAYGGRVSAAYPTFLDAPLARVLYIIGFTPGDHPWPDLKPMEAQITEAARGWGERFEGAVRVAAPSPEALTQTLRRWRDAFPPGYQDRFDAAEALADIAVIEAMDATPAGDRVRVRAYRARADGPTQFRFKLYRPGQAAPLAEVLPILDNMGLKAMAEAGFPVTAQGRTVWVHDFEIDDPRGEHLVFSEVKPAFEAAVEAVWAGLAESDGFNRLVLELSIPWREAALVRALARYRQQSGLDPTQRSQEEALANNPGVARLILDLFRTRFDPAIAADLEARREQSQAVMARIVEALQGVASLEEDRVLRRLALLVQATQRTNFYQLGEDGAPKPWISFKVASGELADLPAPKPFREIYVSGVDVEGVHLRFGPVARGGLRWSDRRDDFRTEVLGLVKAQQVKNAVIVPVGSKGGFYPKLLPKAGAPDAVREAAIGAYRTFLFGLLDLTDNLTPEGKVTPPRGVVVHDGDDPYLVVAADKGTASFSDIANGVAESYGFWLGDAFASGGSAGYDHKEMGITARGAWVSVQRHFRERGIDCQTEEFTAVGIGDMSGDVFGNGLLCSETTRLVAAFDHRDIFLDPSPDAAASYAERRRLFELPRSSWQDYDKTLISDGGGIFPRTLKSVPLNDAVRGVLGIDESVEAMTPAELMRAILKAPVDLLWNGGIGTYVKGEGETHADVGDKANDAIRINGSELRARCVGEGGNLGLTQAGRIEYVLRGGDAGGASEEGGRINTDFIDNSAGVDTSDHEVNIKILLDRVVKDGDLTGKQRNALLAEMTDEVGALVLRDNYEQNIAIANAVAHAPGLLHVHEDFMRRLEKAGTLDREIEGLPSRRDVRRRLERGLGLTTPELSVLMAWTKIVLADALLAGDLPDDPYLDLDLKAYFPTPMREQFRAQIEAHPLRREIIVTQVVNDLVNGAGMTYWPRLADETGASVADLTRANFVAREIYASLPLRDELKSYDNQLEARVQTSLRIQMRTLVERASRWLVNNRRPPLDSHATVQQFAGPVQATMAKLPELMVGRELEAFQERQASYERRGVPEDLARRVAVLEPAYMLLGVVEVAQAFSDSGAELAPDEVARVHFALGERLGLPVLLQRIVALPRDDKWQTMARAALRDDLHGVHTALTAQVLRASSAEDSAPARIAAWEEGEAELVRRAADTLEQICVEEEADLARMSVGLRVVRGLLGA